MYSRPAGFFMTGTGNSHKVAKWFLQGLGQEEPRLVQIQENQPAAATLDNDLLVFSYPTHGFTAPWLMIKHIFRLPRGHGTHAVVLPTRAGTRLLGLCLPGMEGTAGYLIALLLWLRGYFVRGVSAVDMPSNWTAVHSGLNPENAGVIAGRGQAKVMNISQQILAGRALYNGFIPLILGLLLAQLSFMYLIVGQLVLAKLFFASDHCSRCGLCLRICPRQAIRLLGDRPYWTYACDSCMACMNYCPASAVQVSSPSFVLFSCLLSLPVTAWLTEAVGAPAAWLAGMGGFAIQYLYTLACAALIYLLLHQALRLKPAAALLATLSHTTYLRRYQAPGVSLKDIHNH
ncbi:MAG: EFR1 family ferrodoxin [Negativicutes bacterium]|nr:EFR1 family ferrodoxin [Negativicutes bacterium]